MKKIFGRNKLFLLSLIIIFILFILLMIYQPLTFKPSAALPHLPELVGVIHVHSNFSDGRLPPEKIAEEAKESGLDFVILTDHGNPNLKVIEKEGEIGGVHIISGSEVSLFDGTLLALGVKKPSYKISPIANEAIDDIKELGGVSIIAHPENKKNNLNWSELKGLNGVEIIDLDDEIRGKSLLKILRALLIYPVNSRFSLLTLIDRPKSIENWDAKLKKEKIFGIYGLNVHGKLWILPFSYSKIFNLMKIHIPLEEKKPKKFEDARRIIIEALKKGLFFSSIDGAGDPRGFRFYFTKGEEKIPMGGNAEIGSTLNIELPYKVKFEAIIFKDGKKYISTDKRKFKIKVNEEGVYRAEVYLKDNKALKGNIPWILSNPVFVREERIEKENEIKGEMTEFISLKKFVPENDVSSEGGFVFSEDFIRWSYRLGFSSPSRPYVWCALALREKLSLEGYKGISVKARAFPSARVWLQLRDRENGEERWWSVSLKVKEEYMEKFYKFDDFRLIQGRGEKLRLKDIEGIFLVIDKGSMGEGSKGEIDIKSISLMK